MANLHLSFQNIERLPQIKEEYASGGMPFSYFERHVLIGDLGITLGGKTEIIPGLPLVSTGSSVITAAIVSIFFRQRTDIVFDGYSVTIGLVRNGEAIRLTPKYFDHLSSTMSTPIADFVDSVGSLQRQCVSELLSLDPRLQENAEIREKIPFLYLLANGE